MDRYTYSEQERAALEGLQQPLAIYQLIDNRIVTLLVSDGFCKLLGYADREQAIWDMDHDMYKDTHPDDRKRISDAARRFAAGGEDYEAIFRTRAGVDSDYQVIHAHGKHVYTETGVRLAHVWYMDEGKYIEGDEAAGTQMNRELNSILHEESILRSANYDALTGLSNLGYFFKRCDIEKARVFSEGHQWCLLYIDLNGMKYYNHRYGFAEGDNLLKAFAGLLAETFGHEDCCHIGADRFAVSTKEDGLEDRLKRLFDGFDRQQKHLPIRVGVYSTGTEDVPVSTAYDRAKIACDSIPQMETSRYNQYTKAMSDANRRRGYIQSHIEKAIAQKWIQVYFQPIVRAVNEKICDEEALARWNDPELGFLSPNEFIPQLEASGQIYKLDLYVLEQVLEKINLKKRDGLNVVPHSINLSRSDFETCDIVEEIRKRVDAAGVGRDLITIEITESVIGSNLDFMKSRVERFRQLGFPVWMDDFGSGYSSLEVLQSIQFDLIKFDMSFMRKLNEGDNARIVLTELMKLATSLGVDTICEGVETAEQVRFLQEIGCSKLQGFHYSKPLPFDEILKHYANGLQIGFEDPATSSYYEMIGRVNVYDLDVIASQEENSLRNSFNSIPVGIIEVQGEKARFVRSNPSYREFVRRFFGLKTQSDEYHSYSSQFMENVLKGSSGQDGRTVFDASLPDGTLVHIFARRIGTNPKTGDIAIVIAILSVNKPNEELLLERTLSVIEQFGEHIPGGFFISRADGSEELLYANKAVCDIYGCDSLEDFKAYTGFSFRNMIHPEDHHKVVDIALDMESGRMTDHDSLEYRIIRKDGEIRWVDDHSHFMKADAHHSLYFVFISDITERHLKAESDKAKYAAVIEALTRAYDSVWLIKDIETQEFELYRVDDKMAHLMPAQAAAKIKRFYDAFTFYSNLVIEEDRQFFLNAVTPQSIEKNTQDKPIYSVPFRRRFEDGVRHYRVEFAKLELADGKVNIVTAFKDVDGEAPKQA